jgi:hypothetical protein
MKQTTSLSKFYNIQRLDFTKIQKEFTKSIHENVFHVNLDYLLMNSEFYDFNKNVWKMRPDYFCADIYKNSFIYPIILLCNKLKSVFEFVPEKLQNNIIVTPKLESITKILKFKK